MKNIQDSAWNALKTKLCMSPKMYLLSNKSDLSDISASAPAGGHLGGPGLTLQEQTHRRREIGG